MFKTKILFTFLFALSVISVCEAGMNHGGYPTSPIKPKPSTPDSDNK